MASHLQPGAIAARGFGWRHAGRIKPALTDVTFDVAPGERVLVLGESGAGKSTLLAAIAGVLGGAEEGDFTGSLTVSGADVRDVDALRGEVGLLLQDPDSQVIAARVGDDVAFGCENRGIPAEEIWPRVRWALDVVGLDLPLDHPTQRLSGGQKQRLALAGIIAMGARVVVLDEPTANIDPEGSLDIVRAVSAAVAETGATLVVVEHRVSTWASAVDSVLVLGEGGEVRARGEAESVLREQANSLARAGIWVPEEYLDASLRTAALAGVARAESAEVPMESAISTAQLSTGWEEAAPVGPPRNLEIPAGRSTVITGKNGAGKSTLALTLAGLLAPLSGQVQVRPVVSAGLGSNPLEWSSAQLAQRIGFVFQDPEHQFLMQTVREELLIAPAIAHKGRKRRWGRGSWRRYVTPAAEARADELLERLGLAHLAQASPYSLSGGQKRRLSVGTALSAEPRALFLDEPTFGQDRNTFLEIVALLRELLAEGSTLVSITHDDLFTEIFGQHRLELAAQ